MFQVEFYDAQGLIDHNATVASLEELSELAQGRRASIVGYEPIDHNEAMEVIDAYREFHKLPGTLETLQSMKANPNLTHRQRHAFKHIFDGMRRLFVGEDA